MSEEELLIQTNLGEREELLIQKSLGEGLRIEDEWRDMRELTTREDTCPKRSWLLIQTI